MNTQSVMIPENTNMESSDIVADAEILLDKANILIKNAKLFYIFKPTEIKLMSKDKLKTYLKSDWTTYEEKAHDLMHISYQIRKLALKLPPSYQQRCTDTMVDLKYYSSLVTSTMSMIIGEGDTRKIKFSEPKIKLDLEDAPRFNGTIFPCHFYEFHQAFTKFLEQADVSLHASAPLWIKSLDGLAKSTIERIYPNKFIPEVGDLLASLKSIFGQNNEIMKELFREHKRIGSIPAYLGNTDHTDWKTICMRAVQHRILLSKLSYLPIQDATFDIEDILEANILPFHHLETLRNTASHRSTSSSTEQKIETTIKILKEIEEFSERQYKKRNYGRYCISTNNIPDEHPIDDFDIENIVERPETADKFDEDNDTDIKGSVDPEDELEQPSNWWDSLDWDN